MPEMPAPHATAAAIIERLINNRLFQQNAQGQQDFLGAKAEVGVGLESRSEFGDAPAPQKQDEKLRITLFDPHVDTNPALVRDHVLKILSETPLKDVASFGSEKDNAKKLKEKLADFIAKGADIPKNYLEWRGFSQDLKESFGREIQDHALEGINKNNWYIDFSISVPPTESDDSAATTDVKRVETNLQARLPQIKQLLAERIIKYSGQINDIQKQEIAAAVSQLDIQFSAYESEYRNSISVHIRSPQQKAYAAMQPPQAQTVNEEELAASNILSKFSKDQLGKALGRAFLEGGENAGEVFPIIAGREDMQKAIIKSLSRLKAAKPELGAEIDTFLNDDMFKSHDWKEHGKNLKQVPAVNKDPAKPGEMTIDFTLPAGQAASVLEKLSALGAGNPPQFATVDKVELVGFIPAEAALQASLTPLAERLIGSVAAAHLAIENITKTLPPGQNLWQALPPSVQPLVQSVEEAHNAIQNAVVMAANEAKAQPQPAATPAPAAVNSAMQLLNVPQPMLSHVAQVTPCGCGPQMAV